MLLLGSIIASLAVANPDTTVLVSGDAFLWKRRPRVVMVRDGEATRLVITARDPQFFTRGVATLYPAADTAGKSIAVLQSDSAWVDARSNTNRSSLRFTITDAQLRAWSAGRAPQVEVGGLTVKLPGSGREALKRSTRTAEGHPQG
jgi:hypothetical protein